MAKLSLLGKNRVIYEWVGAYILLSIATSSHRKKRLFWPSCGEGGERAWQGSPHHFQEEEKASDPQFYHQCSAGQGSSSSVPAKSGVGEEAAPRAVNKTLRVSLGLSCCIPWQQEGVNEGSSRCSLPGPFPLGRSSPGTAPGLGDSSGAALSKGRAAGRCSAGRSGDCEGVRVCEWVRAG